MNTGHESIYDPQHLTETTSASPPPPPPADAEPRHAAREAAPQVASATLVIKRGPTAGTSFTLGDEVTTIGRNRGCDSVLDDVTVSRQHAQIRHQDGQFVISDSGSLNSTYLNRSPVSEAPLIDGDEIWIGKFRLIYTAADI
jgi:pSer/pThr/pTyr-binding forkhead associated (FHA) protein